MPLPEQSLFLRHGDYDSFTGGLTELGEARARAAGKILRTQWELGSGAIVLASSAVRARETAAIVSDELEAEKVYVSDSLNRGGNQVRAIKNLDAFMSDVLQQAGVEFADDGLVVVTHGPMMTLVLDADPSQANRVTHCLPYAYTPTGQDNPHFEQWRAKRLGL